MVVRRMFIKITSTISSIDDENLANVQFLTFMRVETPERDEMKSSMTIIAKK